MVSGYIREDKMNASMMYNDLSFKKKTARVDWRKIGRHIKINKTSSNLCKIRVIFAFLNSRYRFGPCGKRFGRLHPPGEH
jgi:hypothetical protein